MRTDADRKALMAALLRFKSVVVAFELVERIFWTDKALAAVGCAEQIDTPLRWTIYETHPHLRDELTKVMKAVEQYNAVCSTIL
jgi:hypothetical protein